MRHELKNMTYELHCNLSDLQKTIIVSLSTVLIDSESSEAESILNDVMEIIELEVNNFNSNIKVVESMMSQSGMGILNDLKTISKADKEYINRTLRYALDNGNLEFDAETLLFYNQILSTLGLRTINDVFNIELDSSIKSITKVAAYHLSSVIANGISLSKSNMIRIHKNKVVFSNNNPQLRNLSGQIAPNFYVEYSNIVYYFGKNLKCPLFSKTLDYIGAYPPTAPDNEYIFKLIYPRFS